eukprot:g51669.t1
MSVLAFLVGIFTALAQVSSEPPVVDKYDLKSYLGTWYQIADYPQLYEILCRNCTTATYALNSNGTIQVWNTCAYPGQKFAKGAEAYAFIPDSSQPAKLTVVFFGAPPPTNTNYWICYLGPLNSAGLYSYAVVSDAKRTSLYILNRQTTLSYTASQDIMKFLSTNNFDTTKLRYTGQQNCPAIPPAPTPHTSHWSLQMTNFS